MRRHKNREVHKMKFQAIAHVHGKRSQRNYKVLNASEHFLPKPHFNFIHGVQLIWSDAALLRHEKSCKDMGQTRYSTCISSGWLASVPPTILKWDWPECTLGNMGDVKESSEYPPIGYSVCLVFWRNEFLGEPTPVIFGQTMTIFVNLTSFPKWTKTKALQDDVGFRMT